MIVMPPAVWGRMLPKARYAVLFAKKSTGVGSNGHPEKVESAQSGLRGRLVAVGLVVACCVDGM